MERRRGVPEIRVWRRTKPYGTVGAWPTEQDRLDEGLTIPAAQGVPALTIEPLRERLAPTRGSLP
ncbi:hypothetical protein [Streptosporangium sp. NPDC006007]|uniref:hypothetical protein n=1 Tax=Streptosporangium sp. NPDC006007 TaxID=3154575 RepID=UPI0033BAAE84